MKNTPCRQRLSVEFIETKEMEREEKMRGGGRKREREEKKQEEEPCPLRGTVEKRDQEWAELVSSRNLGTYIQIRTLH